MIPLIYSNAASIPPDEDGTTHGVLRSSASSAATSSTTDPAGTITSSDFLTLLVTELKNQDPTADQDPNAYINQLVGVNSLQQLISINQDLSSDSASASAKGAVPSRAIAGGDGQRQQTAAISIAPNTYDASAPQQRFA